jgi:hypothetical protein
MADWATISSLATAGGTLVLAVATFAAVKSSNQSARIAEQALQEQRRPLFVQSRQEDPAQRIMFGDQHWFTVTGSRGVAEFEEGVVYLVMSLRNAGAGIGVCQAWCVRPGSHRAASDHFPDDEYRAQMRDLYIPGGDIGLWQGALRDPSDPRHHEVAEAIARPDTVTVELLYSDQVGGQRTISRFSLIPSVEEDGRISWEVSGTRHWHLDRAGPR